VSEDDVRVHHRGARGVDGILRLIELAGNDGAIETMLTAMCAQIATIADVEIASVYVREDDQLVMRGNHGFPAAAIGATTLAVGEGITGLVAECMRPVSAERAAGETAYKHIPGLGEEQFPAFVGVPLIAGGSAVGVLVLQRKAPAFADAEVTLATALGAPVMLAIERRRANAVRAARLTGRPRVAGTVLGRAGVVPTSTALAAPAELDRATSRLRDDLARAVRRLDSPTDADPRIGGALDRLALALVDQRLREKLVAAAGQEGGLRAVVKEYARAPYRLGTASTDDQDRVDEIEELCVLIGVAADARSTARTGAVWIADRAGAFVTIAAVARGAAALVTTDAVTETAIAIARAAALPMVSSVSGLFGWVRPGDLLAVDGTEGIVLVHPSPSDIEKLRRARRDDG
jgi:signal transduction protein with GAF and PtsI domain